MRTGVSAGAAASLNHCETFRVPNALLVGWPVKFTAQEVVYAIQDQGPHDRLNYPRPGSHGLSTHLPLPHRLYTRH